MKTLSKQITNFLEQLQDILSNAEKERKITIMRYESMIDEQGNFNLYKSNTDYQFNENYNYYKKDKRKFLNKTKIVRYHIIDKPGKNNNLAIQFIQDLKNSLLDNKIVFQLVEQYNARDKFQWINMFFDYEMLEKERKQIFRILGPSERFHDLIFRYHSREEYYPLMVSCVMSQSMVNADLYYKHVLETFLKDDKYIELAVKYTIEYVKQFEKDIYDQQALLDDIRKITKPENWMKFKDAFPLLEIHKKNKQQRQASEEIITNITKIKFDCSAIIESYDIFMVPNDVYLVLDKVKNYFNNKDNLLKIDNMFTLENCIYLESIEKINTLLFMKVIESLFEELSLLNIEDFNRLVKKDKQNSNYVEKQLSTLILENKLPEKNNIKTKIKKI